MVPLLLFLLFMTSCTLPSDTTAPPVVEMPAPAPPPPPEVVLAPVPERLACEMTPSSTIAPPDYSCSKQLDRLRTQLTREVPTVQLANLGPTEATPAPKRREKVLKPEDLIQQAHNAALVQPSERGYFGGSAVQRYVWMPNKIYTVYVAPSSATKLVLPPGELLAHALTMDKEEWDVGSAKIRTDTLQQDIVFIRPLHAPLPPLDVSLVSEQGHSFNVRLIVGKQAMLGVTWEVFPLVTIPVEDPDPIFPKPLR